MEKNLHNTNTAKMEAIPYKIVFYFHENCCSKQNLLTPSHLKKFAQHALQEAIPF